MSDTASEDVRLREAKVVGEFLSSLAANYQLLYACEISLPLAIGTLEKRTTPGGKDIAARARLEMNNDFRTLRAHAVVTLCGAVEVLVSDLVLHWLLHNTNTLKAKPWLDTKISIAEFDSLNREERVRFLVEDYKLRRNLDSKAGVDRFEGLLETIGLSGPVDDGTKRNIYELFQIRNVLLHRNSLVDQRLLDACPWLKYGPGDRIRIGQEDYDRYWEAVTSYGSTILKRLEDKRSKPVAAVLA